MTFINFDCTWNYGGSQIECITNKFRLVWASFALIIVLPKPSKIFIRKTRLIMICVLYHLYSFDALCFSQCNNFVWTLFLTVQDVIIDFWRVIESIFIAIRLDTLGIPLNKEMKYIDSEYLSSILFYH